MNLKASPDSLIQILSNDKVLMVLSEMCAEVNQSSIKIIYVLARSALGGKKHY